MTVQLFAVTEKGPQSLPVPTGATTIHDAFQGLPLGVYSALRTYHHYKFLGLKEHLDRTELSMSLLGWQYKLDRAQLCQALDQVCRSYPFPDARVRIDVLAGTVPVMGGESRVLIALAPFHPIPESVLSDGVEVDLAPRLHRDSPKIKEASFVLQRAQYPLGVTEAYEYLLLGEQEIILEGTSSNFYSVVDGTLHTAGTGVLEGITRRIILCLVNSLAIPLSLESVTLAQIPILGEAFLSSSSRGVVPIIRIAGQSIGDEKPGPITRQLQSAYQAYVDDAVCPAI